jgi:hypothetical protein
VERIMPVEYSPAVTSTPSTPRASCAKFVPNRDRLTAVAAAKSASMRWPELILDLYSTAARSPNATRNSSAKPRVIQVERKDHSFAHSECSTRPPQTR